MRSCRSPFVADLQRRAIRAPSLRRRTAGFQPERRDQHVPVQQRGDDPDHARTEIETELPLLRF